MLAANCSNTSETYICKLKFEELGLDFGNSLGPWVHSSKREKSSLRSASHNPQRHPAFSPSPSASHRYVL